MAQAAEGSHHAPPWFTGPGEGDFLIIVVVALLFAALYAIVYLYAAFDRWAEHKAAGTPLAKTIPTLLLIALLYEIFPLDHFSVLLPLTAIVIALLADWSRFHLNAGAGGGAARSEAKAPAPAGPAEGDHA